MTIILEEILYKEIVGDIVPQSLLDGDGDTLDNDIVLSVDENELVISVTEDQYIQMLGSLINGAIITYPESWITVIYPLIKAAKMSSSLCAKIEACINDTASIQTLITDISVSNYTYPDTIPMLTPETDNRFPPAERILPTSDPPAGCDLDVLWSGILEMVTRLNGMCVDVLEQIVAESDKAERIARAVALIPFFGDLAGEVVLAIAEESQNLLNAYNAHVTAAVLEDIACDFFDAHCESCDYPTFDEVLDYYSSFGITGIDDWANITYTALIDLVIGSSGLANLVVFYTVNTMTLSTLYLGGAVLGRRGSKWLGIWNSLGEDFPSNDWEILCDACEPPYCYNFDFTANDGDWVTMPGTDFGVWGAGVGWQSEWEFSSGWDERLYIWRIPEIATSVTMVTVSLEVTGTLGSAPNITVQVDDDIIPIFTLPKTYVLGVQDIVFPITNGNLNCASIRVIIVAGSSAEHQLDIVITDVKVNGEGDNPFDVPDNC